MDEAERRRVERHIYPRPPEDVIDEATLRGFRKPEDQTWIRGDDFHTEKPRAFRCGFHAAAIDPGPVEMVDLDGIDGKTYRVGQCARCGRIFWGVKKERPAAERR